MNILLIANADSIWTKKVIEYTLIPFGDKVSIFSPRNITYSKYYKNNNIEVFVYKRRDTRKKSLKDIGCLFKKYDLVHIHGCSGKTAMLGVLSKLFSRHLAVSFWGSDVLRVNRPNIFVRICLRMSQSITMSTPEMKDRFGQIYGHYYDDKLRKVCFGANGFEYIDRIKESNFALRRKYNIPIEKVVVAIGYNGDREQQHKKILETINRLPEELKGVIHIILRLTYGFYDRGYIDEIKTIIKEMGCQYSLFDSFLPDEEIAEVTYITDIFIHGQITDARSASVSEHLYARCLVFNPVWIDYLDYRNKIFMIRYNDFEELGLLLKDNIYQKNESPYKENLTINTYEISGLCSWNAFVPQWREVYEHR